MMLTLSDVWSNFISAVYVKAYKTAKLYFVLSFVYFVCIFDLG